MSRGSKTLSASLSLWPEDWEKGSLWAKEYETNLHHLPHFFFFDPRPAPRRLQLQNSTVAPLGAKTLRQILYFYPEESGKRTVVVWKMYICVWGGGESLLFIFSLSTLPKANPDHAKLWGSLNSERTLSFWPEDLENGLLQPECQGNPREARAGRREPVLCMSWNKCRAHPRAAHVGADEAAQQRLSELNWPWNHCPHRRWDRTSE